MVTSDATASHQAVETGDAKKASPVTRWAVLILLAIGAIIAFASRTNLPQAIVVPSFKAQFHLTNTDKGMLNSVFFWSYMLLQIPMGWAVDRYGAKIPYAISFVVWSVASAATGLSSAMSGLIASRFVTGAGEAVMMPASYRWIRNNFAEGQSGTAVGIFMLGTKYGPALGAPLATWLITVYGWQSMFLIIGFGGLLWLVPWVLFVKNDAPTERTAAGKRLKSAVPFKNIITSPLVWGTIIINFCYNYFVFYDMTWLPDYLVNKHHLSLNKEGLYIFFSFSGIAIVALAAGWAADMLIKRGMDAVIVRKTFVVVGFVLACTELLGVMSDSITMALFWAVASLSGLGFATANHLALCRLTLIPKPAVGMVTGVQMVSTALAGIAAPWFSGWLLDVTGGYTAPMQVIFAFLVIGALTTIVLLRREWAPKVPDVAAA